MHPIIRIAQVSLSSYTLLYALALVAGGAMAYTRLVRGGLDAAAAGWCVLGIIWAGFLGAMVGLAAFETLLHWITTGELTWQHANGFIGAFVVVPPTAILLFRHYKLPVAYAFDRFAVAVPLGQAIGRIGCAMAGCCYGQISHGWLGVLLPDRYGAWLHRYPTQLMSSAANLINMAILLLVERWSQREKAAGRRGLRDGSLAWGSVALYTFKRTTIDFLRADAPDVWGPLSPIQLILAPVCVVAVIALLVTNRRRPAKR